MKRLRNLLVRLLQIATIFFFSGTAYIVIEIIFRGYTDFSMWILGGICGVIITFVNNGLILDEKTPFEYQVAFCSMCCIVGELIAGLIVNQDYHVWDYRELFGTFAYGQLNIFFIMAWICICIFAIPLLDWIEWKLLDGRKPVYTFLLCKKEFK